MDRYPFKCNFSASLCVLILKRRGRRERRETQRIRSIDNSSALPKRRKKQLHQRVQFFLCERPGEDAAERHESAAFFCTCTTTADAALGVAGSLHGSSTNNSWPTSSGTGRSRPIPFVETLSTTAQREAIFSGVAKWHNVCWVEFQRTVTRRSGWCATWLITSNYTESRANSRNELVVRTATVRERGTCRTPLPYGRGSDMRNGKPFHQSPPSWLRSCFRRALCFFADSRRSFDPRDGRVALRALGTCTARRISVRNFSRQSSTFLP